MELDKLLPHGRAGTASTPMNEERFEWVHRDGGTYLVPVSNKNSKITGVRKWEQAFRIYATIYCGTNPHRSKEIWQYVSVINSAASSYIWENVASYDYTFGHLMAFNPKRSWAIMYNQMWNLCMRGPLPKGFGNKSRTSTGNFQLGSSNNSKSGNKNGKRKSDYCWNFNKGVPCKFGARCKFIERCSFCDSANHGIHACVKAQAKNEANGGQEENK